MAQQVLGSGMIVPRRRAMFGLLDADGWAWAAVKAFVWLIILILLLGYIPDRAYYLTVNRTVDLGVLAWSPINLCPPGNETLPCPAPVGAVVPWHPSPEQLTLPEARTDGTVVQVGNTLLYIGGSDGTTAKDSVYLAKVVPVGNFDAWTAGPPLPQPRSDASVVVSSGVIYVIGGLDASGAATDTVFSAKTDAQTGALGAWSTIDALKLPEARAGATGLTAPDGILLIGGTGPGGVVATTWKSVPDPSTAALKPWTVEQPVPHPVADAGGAVIGDFVWIYGGHDASGPVGGVQRGDIGKVAAEGLPVNPNQGKVFQWATDAAANLPVARDDAATWSANGTLYLVGGSDAAGPQRELYWAVPSSTGALTEWKHLDVSDLPAGLRGASPVVNGPNAVLVGGQTAEGILRSSARANVAPTSPFFQLGLFGATVPGLTISGEIGQQLGYLNAAGAGTVNFIIVLLLGWAFAHKEQARGMLGRLVSRRRRR